MRNFSSFLPGNGVGGAGVHWNGQTWRFLPSVFRLRSHLEKRYGKAFLPNDTVGSLAYWTADAIRDRYLKSPGLLM